MHTLYFYNLLWFYLLCQPVPLNGQADIASQPAQKYIFYWGKLQCDLTAANAYAGQLRCTVAEFRQILHSTPYLWTGAGMAEQLSFKLNGHPVRAARNGRDYAAAISRLDEAVGQKVVAGQLLRITEIALDEKKHGRIDLVLEAAAAEDRTENYRPGPGSNMLDNHLLEQVVWGREDSYEISNRDFFTETEFWQTVQQQPHVEWAPYVNPGPIRAGIRLRDSTGVDFALRFDLNPDAYRQNVEALGNYRHLVKPGTAVTLSLHTGQYDRLFEKNMGIVADDDPRLALRRNRDTHSLEIRWGGWKQTLHSLYLLELKDARGNAIPVDPPLTVRDLVMQSEREVMRNSRPEFRIDGQPVPEMRFRIRMQGWSARIGPGESIPDTFRMGLDTSAQSIYQLALDSFQAPGYIMPDLTFSLNFYYQRENLRIPNRLDALLAAPGTALISLTTPTPAGDSYAVILEILRETAAILSIFRPDGENVFSLENNYPPGQHTVEIPRRVFRQPGKYYLFVNTAFGVAKQEVMIE